MEDLYVQGRSDSASDRLRFADVQPGQELMLKVTFPVPEPDLEWDSDDAYDIAGSAP